MPSRTNRALPVAVMSILFAAGHAAGLAQEQQQPGGPAQQPDAQQPANQQPANQQPEAGQPADPQAEAEAKRILDRVRQHYADVQGLTVKVDMSTTMDVEGEQVKQDEEPLQIAAQRPNRAALRMTSGGEEYALVSDGQTMWHYMGDVLDAYTEEPAPDSLDGVIEAASFGQPQDPSSMLMMPHVVVLALMDGERFDDMVDAASSVRAVGQEERDGKTYDRLRIEMDTMDADVWVRTGEEAWVDRIEPDLTKMFEMIKALGGAQGQEATPPKLEVVFRDWSEDQPPDTAFQFTPPADARKVASLMDAMQQQMGQEAADAQQAHSDLLGKPAPEIELELLDGGKLSLAEHKKNKDIVVLDFWATWCPPCVRGLPLVSAVAKEFADQRVVFYAVNQREEPDKIRSFLEQKDLDIKVPLDKEGKVGDAFGVSGIPQTVIIGRDGTVQAVHVGFAPGMENQLRDELKKLVAGENLASAAVETSE